MMPSDIHKLIQTINTIEQSDLVDDADSRIKLLQAAQALSIRLETPWDFAQRITWQEVSETTPGA